MYCWVRSCLGGAQGVWDEYVNAIVAKALLRRWVRLCLVYVYTRGLSERWRRFEIVDYL